MSPPLAFPAPRGAPPHCPRDVCHLLPPGVTSCHPVSPQVPPPPPFPPDVRPDVPPPRSPTATVPWVTRLWKDTGAMSRRR
ncbi:unnamed protein product [Coccothraustes coccothraustes]